MRPIYDRYRNIKRLLANAAASREGGLSPATPVRTFAPPDMLAEESPSSQGTPEDAYEEPIEATRLTLSVPAQPTPTGAAAVSGGYLSLDNRGGLGAVGPDHGYSATTSRVGGIVNSRPPDEWCRLTVIFLYLSGEKMVESPRFSPVLHAKMSAFNHTPICLHVCVLVMA